MAVIGIDVGGHSIKGGIVTNKGVLLEKVVTLTESEKGREAVVENIVKIGEILLHREQDITGIGVGIPGIVEKNGFVIYTPNIPLSNFNLGKVLKERLKKKLAFGNDADNFALANHRFGAGKGFKNLVCLTLGTGVGSGLILNGKLFSNMGAPELGHTTINYNGRESKCCGNDGCIESFIGRKHFAENPLEVYKNALAGDKKSLEKFDFYGQHLGIAIANFVNIFNPDLVILGGEMSHAYPFFKNKMEEEVKKRALFKTRIVQSKLREGGTIGAAILAMNL